MAANFRFASWIALGISCLLTLAPNSIGIAEEKKTLDTFSLSDKQADYLSSRLKEIKKRKFAATNFSNAILSDASTLEGMVFSPPAVWDYSVLGRGIDMRHYPNVTILHDYGISTTLPDQTTAGTGSMSSRVSYIENVSEAKSEEASSFGAGLGFLGEAFSAELNFQSSNMQATSQATRSVYLVIKFEDTQTISLGDFSLREPARRRWQSDRAGFFSTYGTHYISSVSLNAQLYIVLRFSSDSRYALEKFATEAGLKGAVGVWTGSISGTFNTTYEKYKSAITIDGQVFASGDARNGLPALHLAPSSGTGIDLSSIETIHNQYVTNLAANRHGLKVAKYQIKPFAEFQSPYNPAVKQAIRDAVVELQYVDQVRHDVQTLLDYAPYWGSSFAETDMDEITRQQRLLNSALTNVLATGSSTDSTNMVNVVRGWRVVVNGFHWPPYLEGPKLLLKTGTGTDVFKVDVKVKQGRPQRIQTSFHGITETGTPATVTLNGGALAELEPAETASGFVTYHYAAVSVPPAMADTWIEVRDGVGRSFYYLLSTVTEGRRIYPGATPPFPMPDFQLMVEAHGD